MDTMSTYCPLNSILVNASNDKELVGTLYYPLENLLNPFNDNLFSKSEEEKIDNL